MPNIAAIRWLTRGKKKPPVIQYMLLDDNLEYLIYPKEVVVTDLKTDIEDIFNAFHKYVSKNTSLEILFKSINQSYGRHRKDSFQFHRLMKKMLTEKNLLRPNSRTAFLLNKDNLKLFKNALCLLDIDCKTKGYAFTTHLWAIALKATRSRVPLVIKKIWKARYGITRMTRQDLNKFVEFYTRVFI